MNPAVMSTNKIPRVFEPTGKELIHCYLRSMIMNIELPDEVKQNIPVVTIYGEKLNPWEKLCNSEGNTYPWKRGMDDMGNDEDYDRLFVFTKVTNVGKKNGNNLQKNRMAGDGTWHGNHTKAVKYHKEADEFSGWDTFTIGHSRLLTFESSNGRETVGHWTMNEYTIDPAAYPGLPTSDWVICKIKRHHNKCSVGGKVIRLLKTEESSEAFSKSKPKKRKQILNRKEDDAVPLVNLDDHHGVHQVGENFQLINSVDEVGWQDFLEVYSS